MRAIKINATTNTLTAVEVDNDTVLEDIYRHGEFSIMERGGSIGHDDLWVDEEGRLKGECRGFYLHTPYGKQLICGNAVVLGHDGHGDCVATHLTLHDVEAHITWLPLNKIIDPGL